MLSVHIQKDIAEYEPKLVGKLTARSLLGLCGAIAAPVATAAYMVYVLGIANIDDWVLLFVAESVGFWLFGFFKPKGMPFEQWLPLWAGHKLGEGRVFYMSPIYSEDNPLAPLPTTRRDADPSWEKLSKSHSIERWEG